jgi:quinol monooxygenase YgiN
MVSKEITVIARLKAKEGKEENLRETLLGLIQPSRADEGCISYNLHVDPENPALFMFHEIWTSKEALDKHLATPHLQEFIKKSEALLAEPLDVTVWKKISE